METPDTILLDNDTAFWFKNHPYTETTLVQCPFCNRFYKTSLGHECKKSDLSAEMQEISRLLENNRIKRAEAVARHRKICTDLDIEKEQLIDRLKKIREGRN